MPKTLLKERLKQLEQDNVRPDASEQTEHRVNKERQPEPQAKQKPPKETDYERYQEELRMIQEDAEEELVRVRKKKRKEVIEKAFSVVLIVACVYLVFLIYGVVNTNYKYNEKGEVVPEVNDVKTIREVNEFTTVSAQYLQARGLYEKALLLDYRLGMAGTTGEDPILIAPEYEGILEDVTKLSVQMAAVTVPARYVQPFNLLISWVQDDLALYCQYISRAISQNNSADMNQALYYKDSMYTKFRQVTQVLSTLGSTIENSGVEYIRNWSPESYIEQVSGGMSVQ